LGLHPVVLLPFFLAVLGAMNLGALMAVRFLFSSKTIAEVQGTPGISEIPGISKIPGVFEVPLLSEIPASPGPSGIPASLEAPLPLEGLSSAFLMEPEVQGDFVLDSFQNPETREWVISFFERICGSRKTAQAILEEAERYSISPSLAFALSWEESRFNYRAMNRQNRDGSIDRGLFQLNNRSFPKLGEAEFFDPRLNAFYGMAHLRICIDAGGSEIAALAMYNAGTSRVRSGGTPRQTLDYAARILSSRRKIDRVFLEEWARRGPPVKDAGLPEESAEPAPVLAPAAGGFPLPIVLSPVSH
jgi:hypothetical protein